MGKGKNPAILVFVLLAFLGVTSGWDTVQAETESELSDGQTVYVPVYSHIFSSNSERPFYLTVTLSIRNTNLNHSINILLVDYYDTRGKLLKKHLENPIGLEPMASVRYLVKESDRAGGSGANFLVKWKSDTKVNPPIIESVMIGTQSQQGVSFTSRGQVINDMVK